MAADETSLTDPNSLQFVGMLWDKGGYPLVFAVLLFALVWRYGWPKFGASYSNPPPPPNAVAEALTALKGEIEDMRAENAEHNKQVLRDLGIILSRMK